jgi:hypothetical protein
MSSDDKHHGYMTEPLEFSLVSRPPNYVDSADGEIEYLTVTVADRVVGFAWFSDAQSAAGFRSIESARAEGFNIAVAWMRRLRSMYQCGLSPSAASKKIAAETRTEPGSATVTEKSQTADSTVQLAFLASEL